MVHRSSPRGETSAVPVVLCCALAEEADVQQVGRTFAERGHPVEVLAGVELDPRALAAAIDRLRGEGLYVLCRAGALDRARVDALREVLLARRVPFGRTLTVGTTKPGELQERVEQGLKKVPSTPRPPAGVGVATATNAGGRPRRQTIPVIPASVTRTLQGGPRPMPPRAETRRSDAPRTTEARRPEPPPPSLETNVDPTPADETGVRAPSTEETYAGPAPVDETNATASRDEAASLETNAQRSVSEETQGHASVEATNADAMVQGEPDAAVERAPVAAVPRPPMHAQEFGDEPSVVTAIFEDTNARARAAEPKVDEELLDDDLITLQQPKEDDDELPSIDLDRVLAGIGDGPDPTARGDTVIARADAVRRGDTVIARGDTAIARGLTQRASAVPFDGYPEEAAELSLSDGEVIGDRTQVAPAPRLPPPLRPASPSTPEARAPVGTAPRPGSGKLLVAGVAGALALGVLVAVMVSNRDDDGPAKTDPAPTKVATDTPTKREDPKPQPEASKPTTDDSAADAKPELIAKADTTPSDAADTKPADATGPAIAPNAPRGKLPATARNTTPPPPRTRVQLALRQRAVRALDVLLVARRQSKPLAYDAAVQHCSTLDVQGIQGWRLPDVGELASLGEAGMLGRAMYWSQTAGDTFGDTHMAWNGRSNHAATRDRGAVALCVRGDHGQTP